MTRTRYNFHIDDELREGLKAVRERDGVTEAEQIRRAIKDWLERKGVGVAEKKTDRRRAVTRRQS